ncbi:SseB family protein [Kineococcus rhizosphaerae]|uniref:Type III secretion system (T3SS) SseB-like protein n=1 Tax=Kineococcus rhizosphaerae TaxID=559628 RepID=A0A2T0R8S7_9ACTN|nr:SseB family protein [Kineococcus rhizosphaerae]PRY17575.1 type III secretion system (T3SS) SseB-like protein [Kineococcus rhizosphaerae]
MPWAGRTLQPNAFAGDDGSRPPELARALEVWAATGEDLVARVHAERAVVAALAGARVFAPVVAELGELDGHGGDKSADMALALLTQPDGRRGLPLFTDLAALTAWRPDARPVPVPAEQAALSGAQEECDVLVLDPAGPVRFVVRRSAFWALARGGAWIPAALDATVAAVVADAVADLPVVRGTRCEPGRGAELRVVLGVVPGLDRERLDGLLRVVGERLASGVVAERAESLEFQVLPA